ncbi:MAG: nitrogen fixation protein NifH, partial [Chloroflexota bacterium]
GVDFLLSRDPAVADYPRPSYSARPNGSWFKPGFPSAYVTDVLQILEALCAAGEGRNPRLANALAWLLGKQDEQGRWRNEYAYNGKTVVDIERQGATSKWVTLRACRVLKAIYG